MCLQLSNKAVLTDWDSSRAKRKADTSQQDFLINTDKNLYCKMTDSGISNISGGKSQYTLERCQNHTNPTEVV